MNLLQYDGVALMMVVFMLGVQHGIDPDHVATIDGLTRYNATLRPRVSRWSGALFSLGHGLVVTLVAAMVAAFATEWTPPVWLEHLGAWISITFLMGLGIVNLRAVINSPKDQPVRISGVMGARLAKLSRTSHPVLIATVGAAFALSFDTVSQAALFSLAASKLAGWIFAVVLGLVFMAGMMVAALSASMVDQPPRTKLHISQCAPSPGCWPCAPMETCTPLSASFLASRALAAST